ncbi:MAG: CRTAC1 family protein [Candidatus Cloacimonetes bacterium]|nr:CRTAC1 family protein [Candidatus Cloacimonadota bacterium]
MKQTIILISISLLIACSGAIPYKNTNKKDWNGLKQVDELIQEHQFNQAKKVLEKYIKNNPSHMDGYEKLFFLYRVAQTPQDEIIRDQQKYLSKFDEMHVSDSVALQVEYMYLSALDDTTSSALLERIIAEYPYCIVVNEHAQEQVFNYAVMRDDSTRALGLEEFLVTFPNNIWSPLAWRYLLYSYDNLKNEEKLDSVLTIIENKFQNDARMVNTASRYYLDRKENLNEQEIILRTIIDSLDNAEWETSFYFFGDKSKGEQLATYRLTLAELLFEQEKYYEAFDVLTAIPSKDLLAQHYYLMGKIEHQFGRDAQAFDYVLHAVIMGDERNTWTPKADSLLHELYAELSDGGRAFRKFVDVWAKYDGPLFVDVTEEAGLIDCRKTRIAWGDYNNDGYDDILLNGNTLLRNNQDGTFIDVSGEAGISDGNTNGGLWADIDRDGFLDFYATSSSSNREDKLWLNKGDGTFADITSLSDIGDTLQTEGAGWGDINGDLYPDLYIANYEHSGIYDKEPDFLFINNTDSTFSDVTEEQQIVPPFNENQAGRGVNWGDYNNDGYLDIFVSNYRLDKNFLWKNINGEQFINVAHKVGLEGNYVEGWYGHTIGSEWGDFDNDGDMDLICANLAHPRYIKFSDMTQLFVNDLKKSRFYDIRELAGITYDECHSDPSWGDVNGDGYLDLFITSIYPNRRSYLYLNNADRTFTDITYLAGVRTFNSWGAAFSDYDNDGDIDLLVCSSEGIHLFRNDSTPKHWLKVKIVDKNGHTPIVGTRVEVVQNGMKQIRDIEGGKGTTNQHSMVQYFGFPSSGNVSVNVSFLDGTERKLTEQEINQTIIIQY